MSAPQVLDLMAKDLEHMGQMTCEVKKARWARILDALRLSRPQQDALLLLRKQHLKKLHDVYEQRQRLNMQVRTGPEAGSVAPAASAHGLCLALLQRTGPSVTRADGPGYAGPRSAVLE